MKKPLLFVFTFFLFTILTKAQTPTLTAANSTPVLGETFVNQVAKTNSLPTYAGGENKTWNYSGLVDSSVGASLQVVTPQSTPYASSFPNSNLAIQTNNNENFIYLNSQTSLLSVVGINAADTGQITYTTPKIYLPYPFSYNGFFTDSVVGIFANYNLTFRGKDSLAGDGYGTLELPGGKTYSNVLRVQYIENLTAKRDTSLIGNDTIVINSRTVSYLYFTPDTHVPLLTINETITNAFVEGEFFGQIVSIPLPQFTSASQSVTYLKSSSVLPVSFTSFTASLQNKDVLLNWKTAQETNTQHFNIQRSFTGIDFSTIDAVSATGNNNGSAYSYADKSFAKTNVPPAVYYRIQEVDKDGKLFYSGTTVVHGNATSIISLYPNPASNFIRFTIPDVTVADAIAIYDAKGRAVKQWSHYPMSQPITIANLSKGVYFIKATINNKTTTSRFVKE